MSACGCCRRCHFRFRIPILHLLHLQLFPFSHRPLFGCYCYFSVFMWCCIVSLKTSNQPYYYTHKELVCVCVVSSKGKTHVYCAETFGICAVNRKNEMREWDVSTFQNLAIMMQLTAFSEQLWHFYLVAFGCDLIHSPSLHPVCVRALSHTL